jgi:FkbM family methyltransferase
MLKRKDCVVVLAVALECTDLRRTAVDVGANIGGFTVAMARDFARVVAFEPYPKTASELRERVAEYPNVEVHECALSDRSGRCALVGTKPRQIYIAAGDGCAMQTLDHYRLDDVDVLKVDAEGHDEAVIEGAAETIERCSPVIIVECDRAIMHERRGSSPDAFEKMMRRRFGYSVCAHVQQDYVFMRRS